LELHSLLIQATHSYALLHSAIAYNESLTKPKKPCLTFSACEVWEQD